jgi:hypothetical protein
MSEEVKMGRSKDIFWDQNSRTEKRKVHETRRCENPCPGSGSGSGSGGNLSIGS